MRKSFLMMDLLQRYYWFDDALNTNVLRHGWPNISRSHSLILIHLALGIHRAAVIAKNLGVTRQAMSQMLQEMKTRGLVQFVPDPNDGRAMLVQFNDDAKAIREDAVAILERVENALASRIGASKVAGLHAALEMDWGDPPVFEADATGAPLPVQDAAAPKTRAARRAI